jgi:two-component system, response regulator PdtaR
MISALLLQIGPQTAPTLVPDLQAAGILVKAALDGGNKLVQGVVLHSPDIVVCDVATPDAALWLVLQALRQTQPCPVLLFTTSQDAAAMAQATAAGVDVYVVLGYGANRLRPLIQLAQARFAHAQAQRRAFEELSTRFEERKSVDRAKGILMQARQVSDDDAFALLRSAAMRSKQRMGQLSQQIILSAQAADALNRAGQLRMLSQRLVKLHLLQQAGVQATQQAALLQASVQWVDGNIAALRRTLSQPTYGDLLDQVEEAWHALRAALELQATPVDSAERLLQSAERLATSLESGEAGAPLRVLNLAGRQRMLSQRFAKDALLQALGAPAQTHAQAQPREEAMAETRAAFETALTYLNGIPLSTPDIHSALQAAGLAWLRLVAAAAGTSMGAATPAPGTNARQTAAARMAALEAVATESEQLLQLFEQLSVHYERSMQMLLG